MVAQSAAPSPTEPDDDTRDQAPDRSLAQRAADLLRAHPVVIVALLAVLVGAINVWWVSTNRDLGAFDVDEAGHLASALRFQRSVDPTAPMLLPSAVFAQSVTGPLVPVVSIPLLIVGGRTVEVAMSAQALAVGVAAIAAAGILRRVSGPGASVVAGIVVLCLPVSILSARTSQYAAAVGACLLLALWALLASDRGHRRKLVVAFGAAVGAMLLTRTMALAFLPGLALAVVITVHRDRRTVRNLVWSMGTVLLVAGPWWIRSYHELWAYFTRYGYGDRAGDFGTDRGLAGLIDRASRVTADVRWGFLILAGIALGGALIVVLARALTGRDPDHAVGPGWSDRARGIAALAAVVGGGAVVLLTTKNGGIWFEVPLEMVAATAVVAVGATIGGRPAKVLGAATVLVAVATLGVSITDPGGWDPYGSARWKDELYAGSGSLKPLGVVEPGLQSNDRSVRLAAASRWWSVHEELIDDIEGLRREHGRLTLTMSGGSTMLNSQSLLLAYELAGLEAPWLEIPDTTAPDRTLERSVQPRSTLSGRPRVLLIASPRSLPFPEDRRARRLRTMADRAGWRVERRLSLPDGGSLVIMTHPDNG